MLNTTELSAATKTNGCAITYRAGAESCFATCPTSCALNPNAEASTDTVDREYLRTLLGAVPRKGVAFSYVHFPIGKWARAWRAHRATGQPTTTLNYSADDFKSAKRAMLAGIPVVVMLSHDDMRKTFTTDNGVRVVRCPATDAGSALDCAHCGGGVPLCARPDRNYAIGFPGHGASKKKVSTDTAGGCYAAGGNVRLHWNRLTKKAQTLTDSEVLREFVRTLRNHTILRHHIAGDIGKA